MPSIGPWNQPPNWTTVDKKRSLQNRPSPPRRIVSLDSDSIYFTGICPLFLLSNSKEPTKLVLVPLTEYDQRFAHTHRAHRLRFVCSFFFLHLSAPLALQDFDLNNIMDFYFLINQSFLLPPFDPDSICSKLTIANTEPKFMELLSF